MRLVPKELQRAGMTGQVPYYGGRLTPGHVYALTHPQPAQGAAAAPGRPVPGEPAAAPAAAPPPQALDALQYLLNAGVLSPAEYTTLRARVTP